MSHRRFKKGALLGTLACLMVLLAVVLSVVLGGTSPKAGRARPRPDTVRAQVFSGPYGMESREILAENARPGTTSWRISPSSKSGAIEGFANVTAASVGQVVRFYVSTSASDFHVLAYRMGWYGGDGARQVWRSSRVKGTAQPSCPVTPVTNMVACDNWSSSLEVRITHAFVPGDYLFKLVGDDGAESYVPLTVWDPTSHATYLVVARSMTEEGWNTFGGYDFYQGEGSCPPGAATYPPCNRARIVSLDRPYAEGDGAADFLSNEFPFVELAEKHGLDVTYVTDVTITQHPGLLLNHRAIISLGHDETWTYAELAGVERALAHGVNVAFLSAAAIVRHARLQASPLGADREVVDYRDSSEDPLDGRASPMEVTGNTWSSPPTDWPSTGLVGELYSGYLEPAEPSVPFVVWDATAWIFEGTGLHDGSKVPGVINSDIDHVAPGYPMPSDLEVLGHSPVPLTEAYTNQGDWSGYTYSDMTYYTTPSSKAGVFDSGTVNWVGTLTPCAAHRSCLGRIPDRMTGNLLKLFGRGPAGEFEPSRANVASVTPAGS